MRAVILTVTLLSAWGCDSVFSPNDGYPVVAEGECHQLLRTQCLCCGDNEPSCRAQVDRLVIFEGALTASTEEDCVSRLQEVGDDTLLWCEQTFDSPEGLVKACQGYPPMPMVVSDDVAGGD